MMIVVVAVSAVVLVEGGLMVIPFRIRVAVFDDCCPCRCCCRCCCWR